MYLCTCIFFEKQNRLILFILFGSQVWHLKIYYRHCVNKYRLTVLFFVLKEFLMFFNQSHIVRQLGYSQFIINSFIHFIHSHINILKPVSFCSLPSITTGEKVRLLGYTEILTQNAFQKNWTNLHLHWPYEFILTHNFTKLSLTLQIIFFWTIWQ